MRLFTPRCWLSLYFFVIVKEATFVQVTLTFASAIVAPFLFFLLQAMIVSDATESKRASLLKKSLTSFWKLILITLPLIALGGFDRLPAGKSPGELRCERA